MAWSQPLEKIIDINSFQFAFLSIPGLPPTGSWQDLKDHMREAGDVCYADVYKDGTGVVEFLRYDDMKYAARKLDDSKFRSHEVGLRAFPYWYFTTVKPLRNQDTECDLFTDSHSYDFCVRVCKNC